jgi:hypothetical protein
MRRGGMPVAAPFTARSCPGRAARGAATDRKAGSTCRNQLIREGRAGTGREGIATGIHKDLTGSYGTSVNRDKLALGRPTGAGREPRTRWRKTTCAMSPCSTTMPPSSSSDPPVAYLLCLAADGAALEAERFCLACEQVLESLY